MATPPFLPDETKPGSGDLISAHPAAAQTFRDVIESWILIQHNTAGTHKQVTLDDIATPTIAAAKVGLWHESGVLKTRFAAGSVFNVLTAELGLLLAGGTLTGDLDIAKTDPKLLLTDGTGVASLGTATGDTVLEASDTNSTLVLRAEGDTDLTALTAKFSGTDEPLLHDGRKASQAEAEAGTDNTVWMTPLRAQQTIDQQAHLVRGTAQAATGTEIDFTIPAGANLIFVSYSALSNAGAAMLVQLGDSEGVEITGYLSQSINGGGNDTASTGFLMTRNNDGGSEWHGVMTLTRMDSNTWTAAFGARGRDGGAGGGGKTLSLELTTVRVTSATGSFDNGNVNVIWM